MTKLEWPEIEGLSVRPFQGPDDFQGMVDIVTASKFIDKIELAWSVEDLERSYKHPINFVPEKDVLIVTIKGKIIGEARVWWMQGLDKIRNYSFTARLVPEWRGKGIREAMFKWCEDRARQIAKTHPKEEVGEFYIWASEFEKEWTCIIEKNEYKPHTFSFRMIRPNLDNIPDCPLPEGLEIRPILPEQMRALWDADREANKDGFEPADWPEELYIQWLNEPIFKPEYYIVAWDGDRIAGAVQNHFDPEENIEFNRKRGYTENIHVGRQWRGQGLAKAMIAISFKLLKDLGMEDASLNVEADNPTGALKLYTKMGFEIEKKVTHYKKPLW
ncbi:MAG: GNAT family N-acetyltransferase [Thermoplasmata archaeon]|nr:GNAT family N-acetyltransferase [Thermoplasmata archaeon]